MTGGETLATAGRVLAAAVVAGVASGLLLALADVGAALLRRTGDYGAGPLLAGAANALLIDLTLGLVMAAALAAVVAAVWGWARFQDGARSLGHLLRAVATGAEPEREPDRVGAVTAFVLLAAAVAAALAALLGTMMPRIALTPALATPVAAVAVSMLGVAMWLLPPVAGAVARCIDALPRGARAVVTVRVLALVASVGVVAAALWHGQKLGWLLNAVGAWPLIFLAGGVVSAAALLAAMAGWPDARILRHLSAPAAIAAQLVVVGLLWALVPGRIGQDGPALRVYRADAPLAAFAGPRLPRVITTGDGWQHCFDCDGDDCDAARGRPEVPAPAPVPDDVPEGLSVVVIMVDALRYDHLHIAGYERPTSPNIDRFAESALLFERAYAPSAYTHPSVSGIMTSKFPSDLPGSLHKRAGVPPDAVTLPGMFRDAGYQTLFLSDYGRLKNHGFDTGFDDSVTLADKGERITELALSFLDRAGDEPFFLWVTYMGPHAPYRIREGTPDFGDSYMDLYDQEIAFTDGALAPLLERLQAPPLKDRVVVALVADHGEAFGEHGTYNHGTNVYDENVHVPLILRVPGIAPRRIDSGPVSLLDLFPTVANLARLPIPAGLVGHDLTPVIAGADAPAAREVFIEADYKGYPVSPGYQAALVRGRHKLVVEDKTGTVELFDLLDDPGETQNLAHRMPDLTCNLLRTLHRYRPN